MNDVDTGMLVTLPVEKFVGGFFLSVYAIKSKKQ